MATLTYHLPHSGEIVKIRGKAERITYHATDLDELSGFVISSFDNKDVFFISPESSESIPLTALESLSLDNTFSKSSRGLAITNEQYLSTFRSFQQGMKARNISKAVLSRVISVDTVTDPTPTFIRMVNKYPGAFCYHICSEETGTWMGATPEKLFNRNEDDTIQVHSLAGTQPADNIHWTEKEIEEQQFVTDFISVQLKNSGISSFELGPMETVIAGNVAHLRSTFTLRQDCRVDKLVKLLHPTPAVCGTPKEAAIDLILESETHERRFYTGFLGTLGDELGDHLFVNLRCMQLFNSGADIYVGGGITLRSESEKEWTETEMKAQTMLSVIHS